MSNLEMPAGIASELRQRLAVGDLPWIRERFASGELNFLREHIPVDDRAQFARRLHSGDLDWMRQVLSRVNVPGVGALSVDPTLVSYEPTAAMAGGVARAAAGSMFSVDAAITGIEPTVADASATTGADRDRRRPWWMWLALLLLVAVLGAWLLSRCGGDDASTSASTTVARSTASGATTVAASGSSGAAATVAGSGVSPTAATTVATTARPASTTAAPTTARPATTTAATNTAATTAPAPTTTARPVGANDSTVYFASGQEQPSADGKARINEAATRIKVLPANSTVRIIGYTDYRGTIAANNALSLKRAETVKAELVKLGANANYQLVAGGELLAETNLDLARKVVIDLP